MTLSKMRISRVVGFFHSSPAGDFFMTKTEEKSTFGAVAARSSPANRARVRLGVAIMMLGGLIASGVQAQTAIGAGVTITTGASPTMQNAYGVNLGSSPGTGWVTQMPMSLSYSGVNLNINFSGASGVAATGVPWNPTPGQNFLIANGEVNFQFSAAQNYFGMAWSAPDFNNIFRFYNGSQLLATINGTTFRTLSGTSSTSLGAYAEFSFAQTGFDRVVASTLYSGATSAPAGGIEFGAVRFAAVADPAPIPLGGLGGIAALLGMFTLRRRCGGRLPRMLLAVASGGRRQQVQRVA